MHAQKVWMSILGYCCICGVGNSFSTEAFLIRGMENKREKYGTTVEEETMVLLVENSLLSSDVALFAEVTRLPSSIPLPASFWG